MNLDDETILTAYLDGELEPSHRQRVEAALLSSPWLARRLRDLARVRDAVGGLSRPGVPGDLAPAVLRGIAEAESLRQQRQAMHRQVRQRLLVLVPITAVAAALLVMWSLNSLVHHETIARPKPIPAPNPTRPAPVEPGPKSEVAVAEATPSPDPATAATDPAIAATAEPDPDREAAIRSDQERFRQLLGTLEMQRFLIEVDSLDTESLQNVEEAIIATPRSNARHARFHILQGLALDPEHPGEAVVFAVVLDDFELRNFRENLGRKFPGSDLVATPIRPALVAQLTESEDLDVVDGRPSGSLVEHIEERPGPVAIRSADPEATGRVADMPPYPNPGRVANGPRTASNNRRPEDSRAAVAERPVIDEGQGPDRHDEPRSDRAPVVYLVWVEKSRIGGSHEGYER